MDETETKNANVQRGFGVMPPPSRSIHLMVTPSMRVFDACQWNKSKAKRIVPRKHCNTNDRSTNRSLNFERGVEVESQPCISLERFEPVDSGRLPRSDDKFEKNRQLNSIESSDSVSTTDTTDELTEDDDDSSSERNRVLFMEDKILIKKTTVPKVSCTNGLRLNTSNVQKTVRFLQDAHGNDICRSSLKPIPLTERDVQEFWWNSTELETIRNQARKIRQYICQKKPNYVVATHTLLYCIGALQRPYMDKPVLSLSTSSPKMSESEAMAVLFQCDARGFEKAMLLLMDIPFPSFHYCTFRVLQTQANFKLDATIEGKPIDTNALSDLLAHQYKEESQVAVEWARLLGEGDALANTTTFVDL